MWLSVQLSAGLLKKFWRKFHDFFANGTPLNEKQLDLGIVWINIPVFFFAYV